MSETQTIYQQRILDHYKNPSNYGTLPNPTKKEKGVNPLCGDEVEFQALVENNKFESLKFTAKGCAISIASASIITESLQGKVVETLYNYTQEKHLENLGIVLSPMRLKCALLPYKTVNALVKN